VGFALEDHHVVGIAGPDDVADGVLRWLVGQLAAYHSPRDLGLSFLSLEAGEEWEWLRWLPHARPDDPDGPLALVGNDEATVAAQVAFLNATIKARQEASGRHGSAPASSFPAHVVVLHGYRALRGVLGLGAVLEEGPAVGVYAICTEDAENSLPERCQATLVTDPHNPSYAALHRRGAAPVPRLLAEQVATAWADRVAREIAPLKDVGAQAEGAALPDSARFLDIVNLEPPTADAVRTRWQLEPRSTRMTIGAGLEGPFTLDLRTDGPHGLIAGMTGSGKTELLQTIIASLALANRPEWLNFVLIDYKGDSAFKDCVHLPHTVGKVNDLDPYLVERALASLEAELDVRKNILAEAAVKDIEDYQDLHAKEPWRDPLPRLVLVIDEFAELAKELPDFMDGLVSIAQVGRSLGVHLLLATQRPSGVVSPKIRANTNLRIALRVADSSDSTDILQSPDAAKIPKSAPGRAYARLGAGALLPFQSGRVGGRRPGAVATDLPAPFLARVGWKALGYAVPKPARQKAEQEVSDTDLKALVAAVGAAAAAEGVPAQRQPWLDPLPAQVLWTDHVEGKAVRGEIPALPWGRSDVPSEQRQVTTVFDLDRDGHLFFAGSPKSGRSQVLRTLAGSIARLTDPSDLHVYGIDCGSGALNPLVALPHCGAVVSRSEPERAGRLLSRLAEEVDNRQRALAAQGYADIAEQRSRDAAPLPHVVVLLDRWEGFATTLGETDNLTELVLKLLREGASVGVHLVITGDRSLVNNMRMATMTENKWAFRLADRSDYSLVGLMAKQVPDKVPAGRCFGPGALETQVMLLSEDASGQGQTAAIQALAEEARALVGPDTVRPFRVDVLPERITVEQALDHRPAGTSDPYVLVGVGGDELTAFAPDVTRSTSFIVAGPGRSGRSTVLLGAARSVLATGGHIVVVAPRPSPLRDLAGQPGVLAVLTDTTTTAEELDALVAEASGCVVVVVDDAEGLRDVPANDFYLRVVKGQQPGAFLLLGGHTDGIGMGLMGWQVEAKKARQGLLLSPQGLGDGDVVGVRVPRGITGKPVQPGRGWLHQGDGELVQVATVVG
jgi:S-DNA-T family DNA segregation ATPase FtsK/SpoIIIE